MEKDWNLYQVRDKVADTVAGPVMGHANDAAAIREFYGLLKEPRTMPGQHPGDFELVVVGTQTKDGLITPVRVQVVATGAAWLEEQNRERLAQQTLKLEA